MLTYKAPLRDIKFLINDVFDYQTHYKDLDNGANADPETVDMILQGFADFAENVLAPLYSQRMQKVVILKMVLSLPLKALKKRTISL